MEAVRMTEGCTRGGGVQVHLRDARPGWLPGAGTPIHEQHAQQVQIIHPLGPHACWLETAKVDTASHVCTHAD